MAGNRPTTWTKLSVRARVLLVSLRATAVLVGGGLWVAGYPAAAGAVSELCAVAVIFTGLIGARSPR